MKKAILILLAILSLTPVLSAQFYPAYEFPGSSAQIPARFREEIKVLYRKSSKEELENIKPKAEDRERYAAFLRQPDTGLIRLMPDLGCAGNTKVVVVTAECLKYTMPGAGSSYSFRMNDYRTERLADLTFYNNTFQATGALLHGILTRIGDVSLEKVDLQTKGLKYLVDFKSVIDLEQARKVDRELINGIVKDGFVYRRGLNALENTTYVLRSIAYQGIVPRAIDGFTYNELDFDKRKDVMIAFRIVRVDSDKSVTIVWKQLSEKDSPKIKSKKK